MDRHRDVGIGLGDVDEVQIELAVVRVAGDDRQDILDCHGWEDEVDVSWDDELDASGVNDEITTALVSEGDRERRGQIRHGLRLSTFRCDRKQDGLNIDSHRFVY